MFSTLFIYIVSAVLTFAVLGGAFVMYFLYYRRKQEFDELETTLQERYPKACWYEHLGELIEDAESQLKELRDEIAVARSIIEQRDAAEDQLREYQERLAEMEDDLRQQKVVEARLEGLQRKEAELNERLPKLAEDQAYREAKVKELADRHDWLASRCVELEDESKRLRQAIQSLEESENSLKTQLAGVNEECNQRPGELGNLKTQRDEVASSLKELEKEINDMRIERKQLESEVSRLQAEKEGLLQAIEHYKRLCHEVEVAVPPERRAGQDRLVELWQPVLDADFQDLHMDDENRCLEALGDYLRGLGLQFHERVILGFHTSLKVADISPLVVLAGISGTGKSLLPRRYAEGMGLYFLNLAVQPRWDSPQDMFGFYNYLEGRYRATELARALFQTAL